MKKIVFLCMGVLLISLSIAHVACSDAKASETDVVNGTVPMNQNEWRTEFNASLKPMTAEERRVEVARVRTKLDGQLTAALRQRGLNGTITSISYVFGSGTAQRVESGDTRSHDGYFNDQLFAVIKGDKKSFGDSLMVFVQCLNGTFLINGESVFVASDATAPIFTIEKGFGFNRYVDYETSIWIAEKFGIPIHQGQGWSGKVITPDQARAFKDDLERRAVTVECYPGDVINLGDMTYNGKPANN